MKIVRAFGLVPKAPRLPELRDLLWLTFLQQWRRLVSDPFFPIVQVCLRGRHGKRQLAFCLSHNKDNLPLSTKPEQHIKKY